MTRKNSLFVLTGAMLLALLGGYSAPRAGETAVAPKPVPVPVEFEARVFKSEANPKESLPYRLAKPPGWEAGRKYPLIVFLHGAGERGTNNSSQLNWGKAWLEKAARDFNAVAVAPQCPGDCRWVEVDWGAKSHEMPKEPSRPMRLLFELLPAIEKEFSVDPERRYIAGLSMGGYGTWDALCRKPNYFAAAIPICGGADEKQAEAIAKVPVWVFHGDKDGVVLTLRSRNMVEALKKAGGTPKYTEYPGVDHNSWSKTFADPESLKWLFEQKRAEKK